MIHFLPDKGKERRPGKFFPAMDLAGTDTVRKTARLNPAVVDGLMATGFFERAELADYALDFYRKWLSTRDG